MTSNAFFSVFDARRIGSFVCVMILLGIAGCAAIPGLAERSDLADRLAQSSGMTKTILRVNGFALVAYQRIGAAGEPLHVYIEGDGLAWKSRRRLSDDPTPTDPVGLRLAVSDPADNVAYLARPCQYLKISERRRCTSKHWSQQRFSEDVIAASDLAIGQFLDRAKARGVALIGYSGGGAVAALVAARRNDVLSLRTVAGNLDHVAFTDYHGVSPLAGSLNPASYGAALAKIPQRHFVSENDRIIPPLIVEKYIAGMPNRSCVRVTMVKNATHQTGWVENWPVLLKESMVCDTVP